MNDKIVSAADIEQLVADAESKIDDQGEAPTIVLEDLLFRLRVIAGLDTSSCDSLSGVLRPLVIGRRDECLISVPHSHEFCGKPEAHR